MKWHPAKPHKYWIASTLALVIAASSYLWHTANAGLSAGGSVAQQIGFYDLLLQQQELYDVRMSTAGKTIVSNLSSPNEPQFKLQGSFVQKKLTGVKHLLTYTPVHFKPSPARPLLNNNVDLLTHSEIEMQQLWPDNVPLVAMQNGFIFVYPLDGQ